MSLREKETYCVHSVENALVLLEALCEEDGEVSLSGLSDRLGMKKASVFRLMATFETKGYVEKRLEGGRYRLGVSAFEIGQKFLQKSDLLRRARPVMEQLARDCDESVYLVLRRGAEALFLDVAESMQKVKVVSLVGRRFSLDELGVGKVFQAFDESFDPGGPESKQGMSSEVLEIRKSGVYVGPHDQGEEICCVAFPLFERSSVLAGVLAMVGPCYRMQSDVLTGKLIPAMGLAAEVVSSKMGYHGRDEVLSFNGR